MNAALDIPKFASIQEQEWDAIREGKVELVYRALLLSISLEEAAGRLNLAPDHGMWPSVVYRELAEMCVMASRGSVTAQPRSAPWEGGEENPLGPMRGVVDGKNHQPYRDLRSNREKINLQHCRTGHKAVGSLNAIVSELRAYAQSPLGMHPRRVAQLLLKAASLYRFHDPVLLEHLLEEVDVMVFRTASPDKAETLRPMSQVR